MPFEIAATDLQIMSTVDAPSFGTTPRSCERIPAAPRAVAVRPLPLRATISDRESRRSAQTTCMQSGRRYIMSVMHIAVSCCAPRVALAATPAMRFVALRICCRHRDGPMHRSHVYGHALAPRTVCRPWQWSYVYRVRRGAWAARVAMESVAERAASVRGKHQRSSRLMRAAASVRTHGAAAAQ